MRPDFRILADGSNITALIKQNLISVSVTDEPGIQSDTCQIQLNDKNGEIEIPRRGAELEVSMGYIETGLVKMGLYVVDEVEPEGPPGSMAIRGKAADFTNPFKAHVTKAWDGKTIGEIVATIAAKYDLKPRVADSLAKVTIAHIDQTKESDLHFLTRLGKEHHAIAKPTNKCLVFAPFGETKAVSGQALAVVKIPCTSDSKWRLLIGDRVKHMEVRAGYHDPGAAVIKLEKAGTGDVTYTLRKSYPDSARAKQAAKAKFDELKQEDMKLRLEFPGDPRVLAETPIEPYGYPKKEINRQWVTQRAEHTIASSGYATSVDAQIPA